MVGCFIAPAPASAAWQPTVSVCIATAETTAAIAVKSGTAVLKTEEKAKPTRTLRPGMTVTVSTAGSQLTADGKPMRTRTLLVTSADEREPLVLTVNGKAYRGALRTDLDGLAMNVINIVRTEDYLQGVVPQEMPSALLLPSVWSAPTSRLFPTRVIQRTCSRRSVWHCAWQAASAL